VIREDFAAAGGVSEGLRLAGADMDDVLGIEYEADACATATAAGHRREHADVRAVRDRDWSGMVGYSAGPPCQTFAQSGSGAGLLHLASLGKALSAVAQGDAPEDAVHDVFDEALDERSVLALEPMHVIARWRPQWVMLEQVPGVLPLWEAYAEWLRIMGYSVATGIARSEQYGVPQTRKRAILVAHADREVSLPAPTHSAFYPRDPGRLDPDVLPWVSLSDALDRVPEAAVPGDASWVACRPSPTIVGSFRPDIVAAPGYRKPGDPPRQKTPGSIQISVREAGILQSFRADYPWRGSESSQYRQCGNAHPPLMAAAILRALL
jgi:DNA (cytosine-5)-methyltransferase 1